MKVAIVGSRNLKVEIDKFIDFKVSRVITGGATGIDSCAYFYAKRNNIPVSVIVPDYKKFEKLAPILRNKRIVDLCDSLVAVWDGVSKGTKTAINFAISAKKPVIIFIVRDGKVKKEVYNISKQMRLF